MPCEIWDKKGDPVLFNESIRFAPVIYNNLKVWIVDIVRSEDEIQFEIELDAAINEFDARNQDFELLENSARGNSIIRFSVWRNENTDHDDVPIESIVPFQVAYAVSIHKAQGLEYDSVKIIITDEVGELITHNIFYTAITRAKRDLKIYWSPETENRVLSSFEKKEVMRDISLLAEKYNLKTY